MGHTWGHPGRKITCVTYVIWALCVNVGALPAPTPRWAFPVRERVKLKPVCISCKLERKIGMNERVNQHNNEKKKPLISNSKK